jgi:DNA-binding transcriptional MerR regulator
MTDHSFSLAELADVSGIEARTIRSYIEKDLLPGPQTRGRGATYTNEHLDRLKAIQTLRRFRPGDTLAETRIRLQKLTRPQIRGLASGLLTAAVGPEDTEPTGDWSSSDDEIVSDLPDDESEKKDEHDHGLPPARLFISPHLTPAGRVVYALRQLSGRAPVVPGSKTETWHRITVTEDIELSVRSDFGPDQIALFRELADLLRHLLDRAETPKPDRSE